MSRHLALLLSWQRRVLQFPPNYFTLQAMQTNTSARTTLTLSCRRSQKSFVINVCLVNLLVKSACRKSLTMHL
jgi:hypothetical protein